MCLTPQTAGRSRLLEPHQWVEAPTIAHSLHSPSPRKPHRTVAVCSASSSCSVCPCRAARCSVICCWRMLTSVSRWMISTMSGRSSRLAEGRQRSKKTGEMQEDHLSVFLPLTCPHSPPVWQDRMITRQGELSLSPQRVGFIFEGEKCWCSCLLWCSQSCPDEGESMRCSWRCWSVTRCCLEWNRKKVRLLSHGKVSHPSSVSTLLMCRRVDEPQVW